MALELWDGVIFSSLLIICRFLKGHFQCQEDFFDTLKFMQIARTKCLRGIVSRSFIYTFKATSDLKGGGVETAPNLQPNSKRNNYTQYGKVSHARNCLINIF